MTVKLEQVGPFYRINYGNPVPQFLKDKLNSLCSYTFKNFNVFSNKINFEYRTLCFEVNGEYYVPRGIIFDVMNLLENLKEPYEIDTVVKLEANEDNLKRYTLRPSQQKCLNIIKTFAKNGFGGTIVAPPAYGKTYIFPAICSLFPDIKIDIITKRRDIAKSQYASIQEHIGDVSLVTSGVKKVDYKTRVTIYTAGSLHHSDFSAKLILLDEVHELITDNYFEKLLRYSDCIAFGFTATANTRFDGLQKRIHALCGPIIYEMEYSEAEQLKIVVPIIVYWTKIDYGNDNPIAGLHTVIDIKRYGIWRNKKRNEKIAEIANTSYSAGSQTLILVETVEHALYLKELLPHFELCYSGSDLEFVQDELKERYKKLSYEDREKLRMDFKNRKIMGAIATGVWSTGVSFEGLEVLIRADGSSSMTMSVQAPGRVSRVCPEINKKCGVVIDFVDEFDVRAFRKAKKRRRMYEKKGWLNYETS